MGVVGGMGVVGVMGIMVSQKRIFFYTFII